MESSASHWVRFNIVLFSGYALFGLGSIFWPSPLDSSLLLLHLATLLVDVFIVIALALRKFRINYVVVIVSLLMIVHLLFFIVSPLGMALAYIGPSRSFYALFLTAASVLGAEDLLPTALLAFNVGMIVLHLCNVCYFSRRKVGLMFRPTER